MLSLNRNRKVKGGGGNMFQLPIEKEHHKIKVYSWFRSLICYFFFPNHHFVRNIRTEHCHDVKRPSYFFIPITVPRYPVPYRMVYVGIFSCFVSGSAWESAVWIRNMGDIIGEYFFPFCFFAFYQNTVRYCTVVIYGCV